MIHDPFSYQDAEFRLLVFLRLAYVVDLGLLDSSLLS